MNYFELFGIPVQLEVDTTALTRKFFELSRTYHPDYHISLDEASRQEMLEKSSLVNRAWKTFRDPGLTIKYVLQLKGLLEEEEKYELPPDFLMEVLDINEQLMDADDPGTKTGIRSAIDRLREEVYEPVKDIIRNYREGITTEKELLDVKAYYYKQKYLDRIEREISEKK